MALEVDIVEFDRVSSLDKSVIQDDGFMDAFKAAGPHEMHGCLFAHSNKNEDQATRDARDAGEESPLCSLLRSSPNAIAVCSDDGLILYLNPAAQRLFGYHAGEIAGHKFASLLMPVPPDDLALSEDYWESAARNDSLKARKKSGEIFPVALTKSELEVEGLKRCVISFRDTSSRQRLKQHVAELQRELLHLARFTAMGELATAITHELRQPLAAIISYAAAARHASAASNCAESEKFLEIFDKISGQAQRCGDIIRKLRQLVNDRSVDRVYADLCTTIQEAVQLASMGAAKHSTKILVELPPQPVVALIDRAQILMLVSNLVKNAVDELSTWRHERKIEVALTLPSPYLAQLTVADTGPGILSSFFENIFDPFHTTKPDGSGMGLALSRRIAEAHGGRLAAANRPGGGAVFTFSIPIGQGKEMGE